MKVVKDAIVYLLEAVIYYGFVGGVWLGVIFLLVKFIKWAWGA